MIGHYRELLLLYRWRVVLGMLTAWILAWTLGSVQLARNPSYEATVVMNMQPSESALLFNREFLGRSQFNPATIIAQTHVERLLSRPIARETLRRLRADGLSDDQGLTPASVGLGARARRLWARLNYGEFRTVPPEIDAENRLIDSLDVDVVEGSYILRLTVTREDPAEAAAIALTHAQSYIDLASREYQSETSRAANLIRDRIAEREGELQALYDRRDALRAEYDVANLQRQSELLMLSLREAERARADTLMERRIQLRRLEDLKALGGTSGRGTARDIEEQIALLDEQAAFRADHIAEMSRQLSVFSTREAAFDNIESDVRAVQENLQNLRRQLLSFELGEQVQADQVQIVSGPDVPVYPSSPKVLQTAIVATIAGGLLVFLVAVLQDIFGARIRTTNDLQAVAGERALPHADRILSGSARGRIGLRRLGRTRRFKRFIEVFGQRMSVGAAWSSGQILVTGYMEQDDLVEVRDFLGEVVKRSVAWGYNERPLRITAIGPIYAIQDWDNLPDGAVVVVMHPDEQDDVDVSTLLSVGLDHPRKPLFMLWN